MLRPVPDVLFVEVLLSGGLLLDIDAVLQLAPDVLFVDVPPPVRHQPQIQRNTQRQLRHSLQLMCNLSVVPLLLAGGWFVTQPWLCAFLYDFTNFWASTAWTCLCVRDLPANEHMVCKPQPCVAVCCAVLCCVVLCGVVWCGVLWCGVVCIVITEVGLGAVLTTYVVPYNV